ncbi:MAG: ribonuclease III [Candidatus Omnitrophica bacterium]|nr:ribonuclease III [Candidatus Omnitrophota bacterium]
MSRDASSKGPITKTSVKKTLGIMPRNLSWYLAALAHPSYRNESRTPKAMEDFDRLEFLGDSILNEIVCQKLFTEFPDADEGMLSKLRSILVSQKILSRIAKALNLKKILLLGKNLRHQFKGPVQTKILTDALEALLAALYFDLGPEKVERFVLKHFRAYFDPKLLFRLDPNPKSTLQEMTLKRWQKLPEYSHVYSPQGVKTVVSLGRSRRSIGWDKTKRESELKAARGLIRLLRKEFAQRQGKEKRRY